MIWDCPRSQTLWNFIENLIATAYNVNYLSYKTIVLGSDNQIPLVENLILIALKLIMSKDRDAIIEIEQFKTQNQKFLHVGKIRIQK
jgi:hypothetical protein